MKKQTSLIIVPISLLFLLIPLLSNTIPADFEPTQITSEESILDTPSIDNFENETILVHDMSVTVRLDNSLKVYSSFVLANNDTSPIEYFIYTLNRSISSVFVFDPISSLPFSWTIDPVAGNIINITMRYPLLQDDIYVFTISYELENEIYQIFNPVEYNGLDYEIEHTRAANIFNLAIELPLYSQLLDQSNISPVNPPPDRTNTEDGRITISWSIDNVDLDDVDLFLVRYVIGATLVPQSNLNLLPLYIVLAFLGGVGISILAFYFFYRMKFKPVESELVTSLLSKDEQEIIKAINLDDGVSTQRRICDKTGFSKSKVSQILSKLEEKDVLTRERWGRTNKVTLTKQSFKNIGQEQQAKEKSD